MLLTACYGLDRSWAKNGSCFGWGTKRPGQPTPWQVAPGRRYGDYSGSELVKYALLWCHSCPAQYDCASFAVRGKMIAGTWGLPITQLRWLQEQDDAFDLIELARQNGIAVQTVASEAFDASVTA